MILFYFWCHQSCTLFSPLKYFGLKVLTAAAQSSNQHLQAPPWAKWDHSSEVRLFHLRENTEILLRDLPESLLRIPCNKSCGKPLTPRDKNAKSSFHFDIPELREGHRPQTLCVWKKVKSRVFSFQTTVQPNVWKFFGWEIWAIALK